MKLEILKSKLQTLVKTIKLYPMVLFAILIATIFSIMEIWKIEFNVLNGTLIVDLIISSLYFAMSYMIVKLIITDKNIEITNGQKAVVYAIVSVIVGLLCYFLIIKVDKSLYLKNQITQMGLFFALFIGMFVAGHFNTEIDYADYAVKIILAIIESLIYCVTIFIGIVAILYTTKELFKLNFNLSNLIVTCAVVIFFLLNKWHNIIKI